MNEPQQHKYSSFFERNLEGYLEILRQMVAINSFTYNPDGVNRLGRLTGEYFSSLDFKPTFFQSENRAFGKHLVLKSTQIDKEKPFIGLISHLDTTPTPLCSSQRR